MKDGDTVAAGDVLLRFDDTLLSNELESLQGQYWELIARRNRLEAERDGADGIDFDRELVELSATHPSVLTIMSGQSQLFEARIRTIEEQTKQLRERQKQIRDQIDGAQSQSRALSRQLDLVARELVGQQKLYDQGLAQLNRLLSLQREEARLQGQVGELAATIAESRGKLSEIEIQILQLSVKRQEDAIAQMRDIQYQENQIREKLASVTETLARMEVRAPISGKVHGMTVHALRSVVRPGEPILYIIPTDVDLVIESQIEPINVDQVHPGQAATLRFSAFSSRTTPEIEGHVVKISPRRVPGRAHRAVLVHRDAGAERRRDGQARRADSAARHARRRVHQDGRPHALELPHQAVH